MGPQAPPRLRARQILVSPEAPPLTELQRLVIDAKTRRTIDIWNSRHIVDHVVFYHNPHSTDSVKARSLLLNTLHNHAEHVVPFRFLLELRDSARLSPDAFAELLYASGKASFQDFIHPNSCAQHIPTAAMLHAVVAADPACLRSPIVYHFQAAGAPAPAVSWGRAAVFDLCKEFEARRSRQVGATAMTIIRRLGSEDKMKETLKRQKNFEKKERKRARQLEETRVQRRVQNFSGGRHSSLPTYEDGPDPEMPDDESGDEG
ncbi:hypothetical protein B0H17DRAFT_1325446 [Mycena rosella]|uniref:Uncharacterized protein n=1 Tax=Mycena rosella TaxID=1033263 RepID=A0AAD7MA30_MYCRO|nr:hypothetical protein B0H17DRAFT_1325446 [Mycena rosella]